MSLLVDDIPDQDLADMARDSKPTWKGHSNVVRGLTGLVLGPPPVVRDSLGDDQSWKVHSDSAFSSYCSKQTPRLVNSQGLYVGSSLSHGWPGVERGWDRREGAYQDNWSEFACTSSSR